MQASGPTRPEETTRVLLVEDDPITREAMTAVLARGGYDVTAAGSTQEAAEAATQVFPDVLIVDWLLPDGTGLQVAGQVRASCPSAAVILLSGFSCEELRAEACELRPAAILRKPVASEHLIEAVQAATWAVHK